MDAAPTTETTRAETPAAKPARKFLVALLVLVCLGLLTLVALLEWNRRQLEAALLEQEVTVTDDSQRLSEIAEQVVTKIRQHMYIPEDVDPTVATIVDVDSLYGRSSFYDRAQNGDNVIITWDRAILYRASEDRILDVMPITLTQRGSGATLAE